MITPKVSIVTPSFNQGQFLEETILSVLNQDYPNTEYIIIDAGSTDGTLVILKKYHHLIWISEPDHGQTEAINKGFRLTTGDIITYLNSDDLLLPGAVSAVVNAFSKYPKADFIYGDFKVIDSKGNHILSRNTISYDRNVLIYGRALIAQPASFFRRSLVTKIGYLDETYDFCMDLEFWIRAALNGAKFHHIDFPLAAQRLHPQSKTMSMRWKLDDQHRKILNTYHLLSITHPEILNRWLFLYTKLLYRCKATSKRMLEKKDYRIFATYLARKKPAKQCMDSTKRPHSETTRQP